MFRNGEIKWKCLIMALPFLFAAMEDTCTAFDILYKPGDRIFYAVKHRATAPRHNSFAFISKTLGLPPYCGICTVHTLADIFVTVKYCGWWQLCRSGKSPLRKLFLTAKFFCRQRWFVLLWVLFSLMEQWSCVQ